MIYDDEFEGILEEADTAWMKFPLGYCPGNWVKPRYSLCLGLDSTQALADYKSIAWPL
jgi:hypothetical protein